MRAVTTAQHRIPDHDPIEGGVLRIRLQPALCPTEDQFYEFCRLNRELRIERGAEGEVTIMPPAGWESARRNAVITAQLQVWATRDGSGTAAGFLGRLRASERGGAFAGRFLGEQRSSGIRHRGAALALSPAVSGLRDRAAFPGGPLACAADKMAEYIADGTSLGWLIDPLNREVFVYRPGLDVERLDKPESLSGHPMMAGFELRMGGIW